MGFAGGASQGILSDGASAAAVASSRAWYNPNSCFMYEFVPAAASSARRTAASAEATPTDCPACDLGANRGATEATTGCRLDVARPNAPLVPGWANDGCAEATRVDLWVWVSCRHRASPPDPDNDEPGGVLRPPVEPSVADWPGWERDPARGLTDRGGEAVNDAKSAAESPGGS